MPRSEIAEKPFMARKRKPGGLDTPPDSSLSQQDAESLMRTPKTLPTTLACIELVEGMNRDWDLGGEGEGLRLIVSRSGKNPKHAKYQLMAKRFVVLARFEIEGPAHTNPDGLIVPCPHIHRYCEGAPDAWAKPASDLFGNPDDLVECLSGFLVYCNIVQAPPIRTLRRLF